MAGKVVKVNRAPVLTLWAAVVAEQMGFARDEALTLGRGLAGLDAQSKGRRLGIFKDHPEDRNPLEEPRPPRRPSPGEEFVVYLLGREVPALSTEQGVRAISRGQPVSPDSVERYLQNKFGADLPEVRAAMEELAASLPPERLADWAFRFYEQFRPIIPGGKAGWGAAGDLDLEKIRGLGRKGG
jgi:hypothetical protein